MIIAIDFDGTMVTHEYPNVGRDIGAAEVICSWVNKGHQIILFTMRDGRQLEDAVEWCKKNKIPLYGINENPEQSGWTQSQKVYANMYIDDAGINIPLKSDKSMSLRPFVNWDEIKIIFEEMENGNRIFGDTYLHKKEVTGIKR